MVARLKKIDWIGGALIIGSVLMVLLALDFGHVVFPWSSATIICLLVFGVVVLGLAVVNEYKFATKPVIPPHIFSNNSSSAAFGGYSYNSYVFIGLAYYLPLYSQSLYLRCLCWYFHLKDRKVSWHRVCRPGLELAWHGLLYLLAIRERPGQALHLPDLVGLGVGMNIEPPLLAVQAVNAERDTAAVVATMKVVRSIANAIRVHCCANVAQDCNGDQASAKVNAIWDLPREQQVIVRQTFFRSPRDVWIMYVAFAALSLVLNLFVRSHHLSTKNQEAVLGADRKKKKVKRGTELQTQAESSPAIVSAN
ncbi:Fungal trichothecene efflux pump, partial [Metarhizium majus ARSEF 297]